MNKKGMSEVITNSLLILFVVVLGGGLIFFVIGAINQEADQISLGKLTLDLKISKVVTDGSGSLVVSVSKDFGNVKIDKLRFNFYDGKRDFYVDRNADFENNQIKSFAFSREDIDGMMIVREVSVTPISTSGEKIVGLEQKFNIKYPNLITVD